MSGLAGLTSGCPLRPNSFEKSPCLFPILIQLDFHSANQHQAKVCNKGVDRSEDPANYGSENELDQTSVPPQLKPKPIILSRKVIMLRHNKIIADRFAR